MRLISPWEKLCYAVQGFATGVISIMVATIMAMLIIKSTKAAEFEGIHGKIGAGYKFSETKDTFDSDGKLVFSGGRSPSARIDVYGKWSNGVSIGIGHQSNYRDGVPFNDRPEYHKTEIFIDFERCILFCK